MNDTFKFSREKELKRVRKEVESLISPLKTIWYNGDGIHMRGKQAPSVREVVDGVMKIIDREMG